jgi:NAD(P)-dependent dehydrogenase (short-subunit alcohol dehydrogenase family)
MPQFPSFDLSGQVSLVTGAARGLGRAISLALANAGSDLALGLRDVSGASGLVREIQSMGRKALPLQMDVTDLAQISSAIQKAAGHFGKLDILPTTPATASVVSRSTSTNTTSTSLALNLKSTFFASQTAAKLMMRQGVDASSI